MRVDAKVETPADPGPAAATIYDVARAAGVSIASVSRVLNGRRNPSPEIVERVQRAVIELGYVPDSAARALSVRLKEVVGVVMRRPLSAGSPIAGPVLPAGAAGAWDTAGLLGYDAFADETESLQFHDMMNRGVERAAQRRGFDLLLRSVDITDHEAGRRVLAVARKSDGLILHDGRARTWPDRRDLPAGPHRHPRGHPQPHHGQRGQRQRDGHAGARQAPALRPRVHDARLPQRLQRQPGQPGPAADAEGRGRRRRARCCTTGPQWQGNYYAAGAAVVTERLMASACRSPASSSARTTRPLSASCYALRRSGVDVPGQVAVTGFDDIPMARHMHPQLTTVRQPIGELGETAFEVLYSMIGREEPAERDISLPTRLMCRESCGCQAGDGRLAGVTDLSSARQLRS